MKTCSYIGIILIFALLSGCATNASVDNMIVEPSFTGPPIEKSFKENIVIGQVTGGQETNPLWISKVNNHGFKVALEESLKLINFIGHEDHARYRINASLLELKQSGMINYTVTCVVQYSLIDMKAGKNVYNRKIMTHYTATMNDNLIGIYRMQNANEGAVRKNISEFITDLYRLKIK